MKQCPIVEELTEEGVDEGDEQESSSTATATSSTNQPDHLEFIAWSTTSAAAATGNAIANSNRIILQHCQGDCDNDGDCAGNLICYNNDTREIPGCLGVNSRKIVDYCIYPI